MSKVLSIVLILISCSVYGQLNNSMFEQRNAISKMDSGALKFNFRMLAFSKNNEYFNKIADGYTLFGYQLNPSISYQPTSNTKIDVGLYVQKDFGNDRYSEILPTFSFNYTFGDVKLIVGTLEGSVSHRLIEPFYDFENALVNRVENGFQFYVENDWIFFDTWLDWQNMLYVGENDQEELTGGLSMRYVLMDKGLKISIPLQAVIKHKGGQIDSNPAPLQTYINSTAGITLEWYRPDNKFLNNLKLDSYYAQYNDQSGVQLRPFENGSGYYVNAEMRSKKGLEVMLSYWRGHEFLSIEGGKLYASESSTFKNPFVIEEIRELLILRIMHNIHIAKNLVISGRFEPYYDLQNSTFEFSHGLYINYNADFYMLKNKANKH
ncbi:MAG TPA: hypothetical protein PKL31_12125 [Fulvivirga sp.]|nr:hypothetical protein [Fulvivirga sp.]